MIELLQAIDTNLTGLRTEMLATSRPMHAKSSRPEVRQ
jgi:hypothetical protein